MEYFQPSPDLLGGEPHPIYRLTSVDVRAQVEGSEQQGERDGWGVVRVDSAKDFYPGLLLDGEKTLWYLSYRSQEWRVRPREALDEGRDRNVFFVAPFTVVCP